MSKRWRGGEEEVFEDFGTLLRQCSSRAVDRLSLSRRQPHQLSSSNTASYSNSRNNNNNYNNIYGGNRNDAQLPKFSIKPIDILVIQFCMYYFNVERFPEKHFLRLGAEVITGSAERVLSPSYFAPPAGSLAALCESLVLENSSEEIQETVKVVSEFVELREGLSDFIADSGDMIARNYNNSSSSNANGNYYAGEEEGEEDGGYINRYAAQEEELLDLASSLYTAAEYWVRVLSFLNALSMDGAQGELFALRPRYERELMEELHTLSTNRRARGVSALKARRLDPSSSLKDKDLSAEEAKVKTDGSASSGPVKQEKTEEDEEEKEKEEMDITAEAIAAAVYVDETMPKSNGMIGSSTEIVKGEEEQGDRAATAEERAALSVAVLTDTLALSHCPGGGGENDNGDDEDGATGGSSSTSSAPKGKLKVALSEAARRRLKGVNPSFYSMVHARLGVMVARYWLNYYSNGAAVTPPPLNKLQQTALEEAQAREAAAATANTRYDISSGLPLDFVPDDAYYQEQLEHDEVTMAEDEELYKEEVLDYYLRRTQQQKQQQEAEEAELAAREQDRQRRQQGRTYAYPKNPNTLIKPHRYVKVKKGFTWTQYNRTHYTKADPPPVTILCYEFTFHYPLLANARRDMRKIFRIEDTPKGPGDDYCYLVFSPGPPYADVAYRIVKKQWDPRPGGVRISFDSKGKYRLFFRFTNGSYRR